MCTVPCFFISSCVFLFFVFILFLQKHASDNFWGHLAPQKRIFGALLAPSGPLGHCISRLPPLRFAYFHFLTFSPPGPSSAVFSPPPGTLRAASGSQKREKVTRPAQTDRPGRHFRALKIALPGRPRRPSRPYLASFWAPRVPLFLVFSHFFH